MSGGFARTCRFLFTRVRCTCTVLTSSRLTATTVESIDSMFQCPSRLAFLSLPSFRLRARARERDYSSRSRRAPSASAPAANDRRPTCSHTQPNKKYTGTGQKRGHGIIGARASHTRTRQPHARHHTVASADAAAARFRRHEPERPAAASVAGGQGRRRRPRQRQQWREPRQAVGRRMHPRQARPLRARGLRLRELPRLALPM